MAVTDWFDGTTDEYVDPELRPPTESELERAAEDDRFERMERGCLMALVGAFMAVVVIVAVVFLTADQLGGIDGFVIGWIVLVIAAFGVGAIVYVDRHD
jgi:hypothetical protein